MERTNSFASLDSLKIFRSTYQNKGGQEYGFFSGNEQLLMIRSCLSRNGSETYASAEMSNRHQIYIPTRRIYMKQQNNKIRFWTWDLRKHRSMVTETEPYYCPAYCLDRFWGTILGKGNDAQQSLGVEDMGIQIVLSSQRRIPERQERETIPETCKVPLKSLIDY